MPIRLRKFIGTILLLLLVAIWSLVAMAFGQFPAIAGNRIYQFLYYAVAGMGWVLPAMPLVKWMLRPDR